MLLLHSFKSKASYGSAGTWEYALCTSPGKPVLEFIQKMRAKRGEGVKRRVGERGQGAGAGGGERERGRGEQKGVGGRGRQTERQRVLLPRAVSFFPQVIMKE